MRQQSLGALVKKNLLLKVSHKLSIVYEFCVPFAFVIFFAIFSYLTSRESPFSPERSPLPQSEDSLFAGLGSHLSILTHDDYQFATFNRTALLSRYNFTKDLEIPDYKPSANEDTQNTIIDYDQSYLSTIWSLFRSNIVPDFHPDTLIADNPSSTYAIGYLAKDKDFIENHFIPLSTIPRSYFEEFSSFTEFKQYSYQSFLPTGKNLRPLKYAVIFDECGENLDPNGKKLYHYTLYGEKHPGTKLTYQHFIDKGGKSDESVEWVDGYFQIQSLVQLTILSHAGLYSGTEPFDPVTFDWKLFDQLNISILKYPGGSTKALKFTGKLVLSTLFPLSFYPAATSLARLVVSEKELLIRPTLIVMGMSRLTLFFSWFLTQMIIGFIPMVIFSMCLTMLAGTIHISFVITWVYLTYAAMIAVVLALSSLVSSVRTVSYLTTVFILGNTLLGLLSLVLDRLWVTVFSSMSYHINFISIFGTFHYLCRDGNVGDWRNWIKPSAYLWTDSNDSTIPFGQGLLFLIGQVIVYSGLALYLDNIIPSAGTASAAQSWYFPVLPSYWVVVCCKKRKHKSQHTGNSLSDALLFETNKNDTSSEAYDSADIYGFSDHEQIKKQHNPLVQELSHTELDSLAIAFKNVTVEFPSAVRGASPLKALNNLSMQFLRGQITCLLGPSGGGKTVCISLVSQLLHPTRGTVECYAQDGSIMKDPAGYIGVVPQDNYLYPNLTPIQHMWLFSAVKLQKRHVLIGNTEISAEIERILKRLKIWDKRNDRISSLSGGLRRKVCLALCLLHSPRIMILDELASIDIQSRKDIWALLLEEKTKDPSKAIILCTHSMAEADSLGDRIIIIKNGELMTAGSRKYLKEVFNVGYTFTLSKLQAPAITGANINGQSPSLSPSTRNQQLNPSRQHQPIIPNHGPRTFSPTTISGQHIVDKYTTAYPELSELVSVHSDSTDSISFSTPMDHGEYVPSLLESFERIKNELNVNSVSLRITSLSDVFLLVVDGYRRTSQAYYDQYTNAKYGMTHDENEVDQRIRDDTEIDNLKKSAVTPRTNSLSSDSDDLYINSLLWQKPSMIAEVNPVLLFLRQVWAIIIKRVTIHSRHSRSLFRFVVLPALLVLTAIGYQLYYGTTIDMFIDAARLPGSTAEYSSIDASRVPYAISSANQFSLNFATSIQQAHPVSIDLKESFPVHHPGDKMDFTYPEGTDFNLASFYKPMEARKYGFRSPRFVTLAMFDADFDHTTRSAAVNGHLFVNASQYYSISTFSQCLVEKISQSAGIPITATSKQSLLPNSPRSQLQMISIMSAIFYICSMVYPLAISDFIVRERTTGALHLHLLSGMSYKAYYVGNFLVDIFLFSLMLSVIVIPTALFDLPIPFPSYSELITSMYSYATSSILFVYAISLFGSDPHFTSVSISVTMLVGPFILSSILASLLYLDMTDNIGPLIVLPFLLLIIPTSGLVTYILANLIILIANADSSSRDFITRVESTDLLWLLTWLTPIFLVLLVTSHYICASRLFGRIFSQRLSLNDLGRKSGSDFDNNLQDDNNSATLNHAIEMSTHSPSFETDVKKQVDIPPDSDVIALEKHVNATDWSRSDHYLKTPLVSAGLRKCYGNIIALQNLYLELHAGKCLMLVGKASSGGKTTAIKLLTNEIPTSISQESVQSFTHIPHTAYHMGRDVHNSTFFQPLEMGYAPQYDTHLYSQLTGRQTLALYLRLRGVSGDMLDLYLEDLLHGLALKHAENQPIASYSGGMKKRIAIGIAIASNKHVIILDEPFEQLDPSSKKRVQAFLKQTSQNKAILVSCHDLNDIENMGDEIAILAFGKLRAIGTKERLEAKLGDFWVLTVQCEAGYEDDVMLFVLSQLTGILVHSDLQHDLDKQTAFNLDKNHLYNVYVYGSSTGTIIPDSTSLGDGHFQDHNDITSGIPSMTNEHSCEYESDIFKIDNTLSFNHDNNNNNINNNFTHKQSSSREFPANNLSSTHYKKNNIRNFGQEESILSNTHQFHSFDLMTSSASHTRKHPNILQSYNPPQLKQERACDNNRELTNMNPIIINNNTNTTHMLSPHCSHQANDDICNNNVDDNNNNNGLEPFISSITQNFADLYHHAIYTPNTTDNIIAEQEKNGNNSDNNNDTIQEAALTVISQFQSQQHIKLPSNSSSSTQKLNSHQLHSSPYYKQFIEECYNAGATVSEQRHMTITIHVEKLKYTLSALFKVISQCKNVNRHILSYSASPISLEQAFTSVVKQAENAQQRDMHFERFQ